ncbi:MAG TPA: methylmalonyl Co-A mutase-associated GTPase MeaB [Rhodobacteraceae bacterium]|nr:methylmalonyl Co-A mutase-associated GTPase MeaB [Paracoccaceae bacterium]
MEPLVSETAQLASEIRAGQRRALARGITLVESTRADHRVAAVELLEILRKDAPKQALRIGLSGTPGVGKSTFTEALGMMLIGKGLKVAVLAVDPSSTLSGGSILGDKTRMDRLSREANAFIRPSPSRTVLGGVARRTREAIALCEGAGFDVILIETVGVGQSETTVADMVDFFLVLMLPGAGDELQGIKKGILELADMVAVNKADGDNRQRANAAQREYKTALHILTPASPNWSPPVVTCAGLTGDGLDVLWEKITDHRQIFTASGERAAKRHQQQVRWMWAMLEDRLISGVRSHPAVRAALPDIESRVAAETLTPSSAVEQVLRLWRGE